MNKNIGITFAFDVLSPYSFLAYQTLSRYEKVWDIKIDYLPVSIPALFQISQNKPPADTCDNKRKYLFNDLKNSAEFSESSFKFPSKFPINSSPALTALKLIKDRQPQAFSASLKAIWEGYFLHDENISKMSVIKELLKDVQVDKIDEVLNDSALEANQLEIMKNTEYINEKGAFGLPFFITDIEGVENDCFFGNDRIAIMAHELGLPYEGPVPGRKIQTPSMGKITFAFDVLSPYSYFAHELIKRQNWDVEIDYFPVSLVKIMKTSGNTGPTFGSENKKKYTLDDLKRLPKLYDIPYTSPKKFPFNTALLQTLLAIIKERSPDEFLPALDLIWEAAIFQQPTDPEVIKEVLRPISNKGQFKDLSEWIQEASTQVAVDKYIVEPTLKLVKEQGAFGLPYFKVQKHSDSVPRYFFGSDRLENMAHYLQQPFNSGFTKSQNSSKL